jgi:DNA-binding NarL/FixJ family response regulator
LICGWDHPDVRPTLLIVDDHAGFRRFARRMLEAEGFDVVGEADGAGSAVEAAIRLCPDVVLLDIALPDGDGLSVCEQLLGDADRPLVVLTSSRDASAYRAGITASRARGFVPKADLSGAALRALTA